MQIIELTDISKSYNDTQVINNISFSVNQGEIFGLLGPNGAGKTTILRMLLDIITSDSGSIKVFDNTPDYAAKDRIGYLPEERGLYKTTKITDHLVYLAQLKGIPKKQAQEKAEYLLRLIEMYEHKEKKVEELSKGMQQKIQFIAAIIHDPDIIVVDEPFSGLDPVNTKLIINILLEQKKAGKTIILSTHIMEQVQTLCDRILMINKGSIVLYDTVDRIRKKYRKNLKNNSVILEFDGSVDAFSGLDCIRKVIEHDTFVELILQDADDIQPLLEELIKRVEIIRFEQTTPSLNDIFIEIVEGGITE
ncbi:MAG: ABC-2 type transport system ATP-binding protein [Candidatus Methanomarinus sp.]|nr:MAG: ABC-2 type transport system ATP-binding protein [ANME-2 cluster archaeon]